MRDRWIIILGLAVFIALITFPIWYAMTSAEPSEPPKLELPAGKTACIETKQYMIANHMQLLDEWRNQVVREGKKTYTSKTNGEQYEMSLTKTCLKCHDNQEKFCDRCHTYSNVEPYCWDCHVAPKGK